MRSLVLSPVLCVRACDLHRNFSHYFQFPALFMTNNPWLTQQQMDIFIYSANFSRDFVKIRIPTPSLNVMLHIKISIRANGWRSRLMIWIGHVVRTGRKGIHTAYVGKARRRDTTRKAYTYGRLIFSRPSIEVWLLKAGILIGHCMYFIQFMITIQCVAT
jgi:hypothetical protein